MRERMNKLSAGLLMFRRRDRKIDILLVHPGGPFYRNKDDGAWSIPKGVPDSPNEDLFKRAQIEFEEELGFPPLIENAIALGTVTQKGGKVVHAWAFAGDLPIEFVCRSNTFQLEWPPRSGKMCDFPEVDRAEMFDVNLARRKMNPAQVPFIDRLLDALQD
jgi:predicted NUDIX family NTP pyrophosphohydrolase